LFTNSAAQPFRRRACAVLQGDGINGINRLPHGDGICAGALSVAGDRDVLTSGKIAQQGCAGTRSGPQEIQRNCIQSSELNAAVACPEAACVRYGDAKVWRGQNLHGYTVGNTASVLGKRGELIDQYIAGHLRNIPCILFFRGKTVRTCPCILVAT
jgi:hypothetical protein